MKKWFILIVVIMVVAGVQAGEKKKGEGLGITKEKFIAKMQKRMESAGKEFNESKAVALFAKKDKNGDGVLSPDEMKPQGEKKPSKNAEE
jgi:hypothetical protein